MQRVAFRGHQTFNVTCVEVPEVPVGLVALPPAPPTPVTQQTNPIIRGKSPRATAGTRNVDRWTREAELLVGA